MYLHIYVMNSLFLSYTPFRLVSISHVENSVYSSVVIELTKHHHYTGAQISSIDAKYYAEIFSVHERVKIEEGEEHPTRVKELLEIKNSELKKLEVIELELKGGDGFDGSLLSGSRSSRYKYFIYISSVFLIL
jgi:hypothetical protein